MIRVKGSELISTAYFGEDEFMRWTIAFKSFVMTVQILSDLDVAALTASGVLAERIAEIMQWSGRTFIRPGAAVAHIEFAATARPEVARVLPFMATTVCGPAMKDQHFVGIADPNYGKGDGRGDMHIREVPLPFS